ncbi:N-acetyltransferase [Arthrobacter sp. GMC3]|uniref:GNAT family N-acetyltransferase n=1 Tax=Arthrobacter sp. GMC3 TaxID=2058894 RepID=UPI000CE35E2A|nr:N-acetyltransferase [Arthrobacter sp. GMC3]
MDVTIRQASGADASALAELAAVTFPLACPPSSQAEDIAAFIAAHLSEASFAAYLSDPQRKLFVAQDALAPAVPRLLAYTMLVDAPPSDADVLAALNGPAMELSKCYAHPDCHGTGISAALMAASLLWAAEQGSPQVWLGVNAENLRAKKFYEKHGFAVAGQKSFQLGSRVEHDYVMLRPL